MKKLFLYLLCFLSVNVISYAQDWKNKYDSISSNSSEGILIAYKKGKSGFVEAQTGKEIVAPKYDRVFPFAEGTAVVSKQTSYDTYSCGLINKTGKEFVPLMYDYISPMKDESQSLNQRRNTDILTKQVKNLPR